MAKRKNKKEKEIQYQIDAHKIFFEKEDSVHFEESDYKGTDIKIIEYQILFVRNVENDEVYFQVERETKVPVSFAFKSLRELDNATKQEFIGIVSAMHKNNIVFTEENILKYFEKF